MKTPARLLRPQVKRLIGLFLILFAAGGLLLLFFLPGVLAMVISGCIVLCCCAVPVVTAVVFSSSPVLSPKKLLFGTAAPVFGLLFLVIALPGVPDAVRPFGGIFCPDGYSGYIPSALPQRDRSSGESGPAASRIDGTCRSEYGTAHVGGRTVLIGMAAVYLFFSFSVIGISLAVRRFTHNRLSAAKRVVVFSIAAVLFAGFCYFPVSRLINGFLYAGTSHLLVSAAAYDDRDTIIMLLQKGVSVDSVDEGGKTALHAAARIGNTGLVKFLLNNGACPDSRDYNGETPLMDAVYGRKAEAIRLLLAYGADPGLRNKAGMTAFDLAVSEKNTELIGILNPAGG
ncbi:MAG: ankyrin repeat domain-containing protein [Spirochaetales bacterium]|nr:ankyrin repeat domain-containing protein [Spirochaetales bacterium]